MEQNKILIVAVVTIVSLVLSFTLTQVLLRKERANSIIDEKISLSYGILYTSWIIAFSLINSKSILIVNEYLDNIYKMNNTNSLIDISKTSIIFIGLANVWLLICYSVSKIFSIVFIGKRNQLIEATNNNHVFFLLYGFIFTSITYFLLPVFELILRTFFPTLEIPYYR